MVLPDKKSVLEMLVQHLSDVAAQATTAAKTTSAGATHAEAKPEHPKDTRALEQSYLARGQAMRVSELEEQIHFLRFMPLRAYGESDPIGAGALVVITSDEDTRCLFLAPYGGGAELDVGGLRVFVVTPQSPIGARVLGRALGDEIELKVRNTAREYVIAAVG
jgi:hypothetical protein